MWHRQTSVEIKTNELELSRNFCNQIFKTISVRSTKIHPKAKNCKRNNNFSKTFHFSIKNNKNILEFSFLIK